MSADDERLRRLSRLAAKGEVTYWVWPDVGEPYLTDRYGRPLAQVKTELALALDLADQLTAIAAGVETLQPGAGVRADAGAPAAAPRSPATSCTR
jgi:hypothetical protein